MCRRKQPTACYSTKLDSVAQGYGQGSVLPTRLAALHYAYEKTSTLTMVCPIIIYTHHKIVELLDQQRFALTQAKCLAYVSQT